MEKNRFMSTDLSEAELSEFLSEIEDFDDEVQFEGKVDPKEILLVTKSSLPKPKNAKIDIDFEERAEFMRAARAENIAGKRRRVREVKRAFITSNRTSELNEPIDSGIFKIMIELATEQYYEKANRAKELLTRMLEKELRRFIPQTLKILYRKNKQAFAPNPGFDYETTPFYGEMRLHINPDVPNVFSDPTEMEIIRAKCQHRLFTFDKLVEQYYHMTKRRLHIESKYAVRYKNAKNIMGLLDLGINHYDNYLIAVKIYNERLLAQSQKLD